MAEAMRLGAAFCWCWLVFGCGAVGHCGTKSDERSDHAEGAGRSGAGGDSSGALLGCGARASAGGGSGAAAWTGVTRGADLEDTAIELAVGSCGDLLVAGVRGGVASIRSFGGVAAAAWTRDILPEAGHVTLNSVLSGADGAVYALGTVDGQLRGQASAGGRDLFVTKL